jgi:predicted small lipoprotein YifL
MHRLLRTAIVAALSALIAGPLFGCGQRGPLYLPKLEVPRPVAPDSSGNK